MHGSRTVPVHGTLGYQTLSAGPVPGQTRSRCSAGRSLLGCPPFPGVAPFRRAACRAPLTRRGSRRDCPARRSTAHLTVHRFETRRECEHGARHHRGRSPQAVSDDRGRRPPGTQARPGPVHHRQGRLRRDAHVRQAVAAPGVGGRGEPTGSAGPWRNGCSRPARTCSTSRPSSPPGPGCWTPARPQDRRPASRLTDRRAEPRLNSLPDVIDPRHDPHVPDCRQRASPRGRTP